MSYKLITNTGKKYDCLSFGLSPMNFVVSTVQIDNFLEATIIFSDPEETQVLKAVNEEYNEKYGYDDEITFTGYTELVYVEKTENGIKIALKKPIEGQGENNA